MDPSHIGSVLLALDAVQADNRPLWTEAGVDAYYARHNPVQRRIPRMAPTIAVLCVAVVSMGLWLQ